MQTHDTSLDDLIGRPLGDLLRSGGDHRQSVDPATGLNGYRVRSAPREGVPLGSCTASWCSDLAWAAAGDVQTQWQHSADGPAAAVARSATQARERLRQAFDLDPEGAVVLTPSGTDAVFVVSALALARGADRVHHLVVGAGELGSGTLGAARGDTFTEDPPVAEAVANTMAPSPLSELEAGLAGLSDRCTAQPIYLRSERGERLEPAIVDAAVGAATDAAVAGGATVIVHMVAHSKTGLRAPSVHQIDQLRERHGDQVIVLMDAAQGRVAPVDIRRALTMDYVVLFTGSKFYSGPPFSGALFLPPIWHGDPGPLPDGLVDWLAAADLPDDWHGARGHLAVEANPGLIARWEAALAEIEAYHAIGPEQRSIVYHAFAAAFMGVFGPAPSVELDIPMPPVHQLASGLGAFPSVFSIRIRDDEGWLGADRLRTLHAELDTPVVGEDPALAQRFHLGQPVSLGPPHDEPVAVLRVALGARLVREHADAPDGGFEWFRSCASALLRKIEHLTGVGHG